eukprot:559072-Alexandrium_andersonii.AAC.1
MKAPAAKGGRVRAGRPGRRERRAHEPLGGTQGALTSDTVESGLNVASPPSARGAGDMRPAQLPRAAVRRARAC